MESQDLVRFKLLGGFNAEELWPTLNLVLAGWLLLAIAPRWGWTRFLTVMPPIYHSILYAGGVFSLMLFPSKEPDPDASFDSLQGVVNLFKDPNGVFVGWVHYVVFDLLVGRMIIFDSIQRGASLQFHVLAIIPCLFFTMMLGPVGWIMYMGLRQAFLPERTRVVETATNGKKVPVKKFV